VLLEFLKATKEGGFSLPASLPPSVSPSLRFALPPFRPPSVSPSLRFALFPSALPPHRSHLCTHRTRLCATVSISILFFYAGQVESLPTTNCSGRSRASATSCPQLTFQDSRMSF
jgi:hypothetical protein